jgi:hypothetical protein
MCDVCHHFQQLDGEMARRAASRRAKKHLARACPRIRNQVMIDLMGKPGITTTMPGPDVIGAMKAKSRAQVVRQLRIQARLHRIRRGHENQRMTIRVGLGRKISTDDAARAASIVDYWTADPKPRSI